MFQKGIANRTAWENWFNGLSGDEKIGAFYWAGQRSLPNPGSCNQMNDAFERGCREAIAVLSPSDALRKSDPTYRAGWNSYTPTSVETQQAAPPPKNVQSTAQVTQTSPLPESPAEVASQPTPTVAAKDLPQPETTEPPSQQQQAQREQFTELMQHPQYLAGSSGILGIFSQNPLHKVADELLAEAIGYSHGTIPRPENSYEWGFLTANTMS